ncbi:VOC family protein [Beijerinckia sp. L45]|uniref:VOC family protein n=1 Tax=Beijerinckia sp. L45 TaxID=1641855 RepID=UPI00131A60D6|nr:VOC family protein [Beijerinckia sp. L45]
MRGIDHACVRVRDFEAALAWYEEKLGFAVEKRWTLEQVPGVEIAYLRGPNASRLEIIGGGDVSGLRTNQSFMEQFAIGGWNHICFASDDVDATMADLASRDVPAALPAADYPDPGRRVAGVRDLDGNVIEISGPLSGKAG